MAIAFWPILDNNAASNQLFGLFDLRYVLPCSFFCYIGLRRDEFNTVDCKVKLIRLIMKHDGHILTIRKRLRHSFTLMTLRVCI